jgi:hypothetical protein
MFEHDSDLKKYVVENYPEVTDARIDEAHWDLECTKCGITRGFQLTRRLHGVDDTSYGHLYQDTSAPYTYIFKCPVCRAFKQWIVYAIELSGNGSKKATHYFRVTSVPHEGLEDIAELPEDPPSLRVAYKQAIRAMDANAHLAAAAMFRRALQVITRGLLGAKPGNLANELNEVVGKTFNGATVTHNFADIGYIVKEAGNQGAHPDGDPDLLDFTSQDAEDLQQVFMEMVSELFVVPAAMKKSRADFLARRKIIPKSP